jgi:flagellar M-ring protein FliF
MAEALGRIPAQLAAFWRTLKPAQRVAFSSVLLVALGVIALLASVAQREDYGTLYANLGPEEAARIVDELSTRGVPHRLSHAGTAIQVPSARVYDLRLELAAKGLPGGGPVGFEVFDAGSLAMTPFQQQLQFRRALEGELARTISRLGPVEWARVHVNLPARTAFAREQLKPTAAVVLGLAAGQSLGPDDAAGIRQLVAGAVENLDAQQITIVDAQGRLLVRPGGAEHDALASGAFDVQRSVESSLSDRAQRLLDAALGAGRSVVTVSATIDRKRFEEKQERVNPEESTVLSEQRSEETRTTPTPIAAGIPGTPSNLPGGPGAEGGAASGSESVTRESINYEFTRSRSETVVAMGGVQRLSVAVLVDGTYTAPEVPEGGEAAPAAYAPRTPEELTSYTDIVKRAVGFDEERGDEIVVQNLPFRSPLDEVSAEPPGFWESPLLHLLLPTASRFALVLIGIVLLITLVLRPTLAQLAAAERAAAEQPSPEALQLAHPDAELSIPISKDQAKFVAEALRQWLRE